MKFHVPYQRLTSVMAAVGMAGPAGLLLSVAPVQADFDGWRGFAVSTPAQGARPQSVATADFDHDGFVDAAVIHGPLVPSLSVVLSDGGGGFQTAVQYPAFLGNHVETADFDGDGWADLVASEFGSAGQGTRVAFYLNLGNGTFSGPTVKTVGGGPAGMVPADFDGDGDIDLAVARNGGTFSVQTDIVLLFNNGSGAFGAPVPFLAADPAGIGLSLEPWRLAAGDMDGDLDLDLVVALGHQRLSVLLNDGTGSFGFPTTYTVPGSIPDVDSGVALLDGDSDGDLDVAYSSNPTRASGTGAIAYFTNTGTGALTGPTLRPLVPGTVGTAVIEAADVTGDGHADLIAGWAGEYGWSVLAGNGSGGFGAAVRYSASDLSGLAVVDRDGDGDLDVLASNGSAYSISYHENPGSGDFSGPDAYTAGGLGNRHCDAADVDGDGDIDLSVCGGFAGSGFIDILFNLGDGTFSAPTRYTGTGVPRRVLLRDLDGDGAPDLLWADDPDGPPYNFRTRRNDGGGNFGSAQTWFANTCGTWDLETLDIDGDGDLDVILGELLSCFGSFTNYVYISRNQGDGTFAPATLLLGDETGIRGVCGGDFDEDGIIDLVATTTLGIDFFPGTGGGNFGGHLYISGVPNVLEDVAAADVDGDGNLDIVAAQGVDGGDLWIVRGNGDGSFQAPQSFAGASVFARELDLRDVDGDGDIDVVLGNYDSAEVSLFRNDGTGDFGAVERYGFDGNVTEPLLRDFDGDSVVDLAALIDAHGGFFGVQVLFGHLNDSSGVDEGPFFTGRSRLQLQPNPFHGHLELSIDSASGEPSRIDIFDAHGRRVRELLRNAGQAAPVTVRWDGRDGSGALLPNGIYLVRAQSASETVTGKVVLAR